MPASSENAGANVYAEVLGWIVLKADMFDMHISRGLSVGVFVIEDLGSFVDYRLSEDDGVVIPWWCRLSF